MRYVEARLKNQQREETYRIYLTDALKAIADNTAHYVGFDGLADCGVHLTCSYSEILHPVEEEPQEEEDTRSTAEFVSDLWQRMKKGGKT